MLTKKRLLPKCLTAARLRVGALEIRWAIPKADRSLHFLLTRTTKQMISWDEGRNDITLSFYWLCITIHLGNWACTETLNSDQESFWYGVFIRKESLHFYLGGRGSKLVDLPWRVSAVEPYKEHTLAETVGLHYHDRPNLNSVDANVRIYYIKVAPIGFRWIPFLSWKIYRAEIDFAEEVGVGVGSWKGGTLSTSFMIPNKMRCAEALRYYENNHA